MDEESINWFRFSKLIIDVGTDVLRTLVLDHVQTPFLTDLVLLWLDKVNEVKHAMYASILLRPIIEKLKNHPTCNNLCKTLAKNFKSLNSQKMTFSQHVFVLEKCKNDIANQLSSSEPSESKVKDMLSTMLKKIQNEIENLNSMSTIIQTWTDCFLKLCQQFRQDLLRKIENHFDVFLSSCRQKLSEWIFLPTEDLKNEITNLNIERNMKLVTWTEESELWLQSLVKNITNRLTSWKKDIPHHTYKRELTDILVKFEKGISSIDETKLQTSCVKWHEELHKRFDKWLNQVDEVLNRRCMGEMSSLEISLEDDLKQFPSIRSQQAKDFFISEVRIQNLKKKKQLSEQQFSKLCPTTGFPDLKTYDTSLLFTILRCLVYPPIQDWNNDLLTESDQLLGANILRLKSFRNEIVGHIEAAKIDHCKFGSLWPDVTKVLCRLALESGHKYETQVRMEVWRMKTCDFNLEIESELSNILNWCKNDILAEFKGIAASNEYLNMLETIERVEQRRLKRREGSSQTDEVNRSQTETYSQTEEDTSTCHSIYTQTVNTESHRQTNNTESQTDISFNADIWDEYWNRHGHHWHWLWYWRLHHQ